MSAAWQLIRVWTEDDTVKDATPSPLSMGVSDASMQEKIALLKLVPPGGKVEGIGWRRGDAIFYLRFYASELTKGKG